MGNNNQAIGIFDSGVGGTSIFKEIKSLLPNEHTIYLADSKNAPYGPKGQDKIIELSVKNTEFLLAQDCKLIVVACNTATTNSIGFLREHFEVPFIGIEPAIKPAALNTQTKSIGILATKGTLSSALFHQTTHLFANGVKVIERDGEGLVELIELGKINSPEMFDLLSSYLQPMVDEQIDHLVLGCTHYPYLIPIIRQIIPNHIKIIDSGEAVARQTKSVLSGRDQLNQSSTDGSNLFYTNGDHPKVMYDLLDQKYIVERLDF